MMPTPGVGHNQTNGNGSSPWPYSSPRALALIEDLRDELLSIAARIEFLIETTEGPVELVGHRVEQARVRERRRNRRGTRKAQR